MLVHNPQISLLTSGRLTAHHTTVINRGACFSWHGNKSWMIGAQQRLCPAWYCATCQLKTAQLVAGHGSLGVLPTFKTHQKKSNVEIMATNDLNACGFIVP